MIQCELCCCETISQCMKILPIFLFKVTAESSLEYEIILNIKGCNTNSVDY